jgi:hypothetical protein
MPMSAFFAGASNSISAVTAGATELKLKGDECMVSGSKSRRALPQGATGDGRGARCRKTATGAGGRPDGARFNGRTANGARKPRIIAGMGDSCTSKRVESPTLKGRRATSAGAQARM